MWTSTAMTIGESLVASAMGFLIVFLVLIFLALVYLVLVVGLTQLLAVLERRLRKSDGK